MKRGTTTIDRLMEPVVQLFTPDVALALTQLRADPKLQARIEKLAAKCNEGRLTPEERAEYETFVEMADFLAILQAKARALLEKTPA